MGLNNHCQCTFYINRTHVLKLQVRVKLKPKHFDKEMFSPDQGYTPFRRDRVGQNSGGVFIAVRNDIVVQEMTDIQSDCEYVWIKIDSFDSKLLLIGAYCKPHEHDQHSREEFSKIIYIVYVFLFVFSPFVFFFILEQFTLVCTLCPFGVMFCAHCELHWLFSHVMTQVQFKLSHASLIAAHWCEGIVCIIYNVRIEGFSYLSILLINAMLYIILLYLICKLFVCSIQTDSLIRRI